MKKLFFIIIILFPCLAQSNYWTQKANFAGGLRYFGFSFSIGNKGYTGLGANFSTQLNDFWEFDPSSNIWTQKANFPGGIRYGLVGFSIGNKGYAGTGVSSTYFRDFWEWDQSTNTWSQKSDYGGGSRYGAVGFSIGTKGYIGTGCDSLSAIKNDFWEWDQATDTWTQKSNLAGLQRWLGVGFSIGAKGYIGTGVDGPGLGSTLLNDFWEWDQITDTWTQKASINTPRCEAMGFTIGNYGYIGIGSIAWGSACIDDLWEYNPVNDTWTQMVNFGAGQRELGISFTVGCKAFFGTGIINDFNLHSDIWEYTPNSYVCATGIETAADNFELSVTPNPATDFIKIICSSNGREQLKLTMRNSEGKKVNETVLSLRALSDKVNVSNYKKGIYFVEISDKKSRKVQKVLIN